MIRNFAVGHYAPAFLASIFALGLLAGCGSGGPQIRFNNAERYGKVYYMDGIGNLGFGREAVPAGFYRAGFRGDVQYWVWSATRTPLDQFGGIFGLVQLKAGELSRMITEYRELYPGRPVSLVGLSAGAGVAIFACEQLPEGVYVDEVVLVASSLSEHYDLSNALGRIRGGITSFQTRTDLALGLLAPLTVTIDGAPLSASGGLTGFKPPPGLDDDHRKLYERVVNVPYEQSFAAYGFTGNHTSAVQSARFVEAKIAPIIMAHHCQDGTEGMPPRLPGPLAPDQPATTAPDRPRFLTR